MYHGIYVDDHAAALRCTSKAARDLFHGIDVDVNRRLDEAYEAHGTSEEPSKTVTCAKEITCILPQEKKDHLLLRL